MSSSHPAPWFIPRLIRDRQRTFGAVALHMPVERPSSLLTRPSPPRRLAVVGLLLGLFTAHLTLALSPVTASLAPQPEPNALVSIVPRSVPPQFAPLEPPPSKWCPKSLVPVPPQSPPFAPPPSEASPEIPKRTPPRTPPLAMPPMTTPNPPLIRLEDLGLLPIPPRRVPSLPDRGSHG